MKKLIERIKKHKIISALIALIIIGAGWWWYGSAGAGAVKVSYLTAAAARGTLTTSVSGSGQTSVSNQIDLKPKVSGDIIKVAVAQGQNVKKGELIAQLDASDAYKSVRDAQSNLESANLALAKLKQPADQLSVTQAQNALVAAEQTKDSAVENLAKSYDDGFNDVTNAFLDLPGIITGLHDILYSYTFSPNQQNVDYYYNNVKDVDPTILSYRDDAVASYDQARAEYDDNFRDFKTVSRQSSTSSIESLIDETYHTALDMADAVKSVNNFIQYYEDNLSQRGIAPPAAANTQLTTLNGYTGKTNAHLSTLLSDIQTIQSDKDTIDSSTRSITEKTQSLSKLQAGTDPLDLQSQQLTVTQRQNALTDAQSALADYSVRAPFDGMIAAVSAKVGDPASSGTALATLITDQQLAEISLNEVDVAKIKTGQPATLTFDAIDGLTIAGQVAQIDLLGTVSQGVVTYNVKIAFASQDARIKDGMSANAAIITAAKTDVLTVPNSAVKTAADGSNYVQTLDAAGQPRSQAVTVGLANDTDTEITGGLNEGDKVITQTITTGGSASAGQTNSGSSGQRNSGFGGLGGGVRVFTGGGR